MIVYVMEHWNNHTQGFYIEEVKPTWEEGWWCIEVDEKTYQKWMKTYDEYEVALEEYNEVLDEIRAEKAVPWT